MLELARPFHSKSVYNVISTTKSMISDVVIHLLMTVHLVIQYASLYIQYAILLHFK